MCNRSFLSFDLYKDVCTIVLVLVFIVYFGASGLLTSATWTTDAKYPNGSSVCRAGEATGNSPSGSQLEG